jgi:hypothetical protein
MLSLVRRFVKSHPPLSVSSDSHTVCVRISRKFLAASSNGNAALILEAFHPTNDGDWGGPEFPAVNGVPNADLLESIAKLVR